MDSRAPARELALISEVETAVELLRVGLRELRVLSLANDFTHLPMLLLASGLERMMKCVLCIAARDNDGVLPSGDEGKRITRGNGHNLADLLTMVVSRLRETGYAQRCVASELDIAYLEDADGECMRTIRVLSDFGKSARYHYIDIVVDASRPAPSPQEAWDQLELDAIGEAGLQRLVATGQAQEAHDACIRELQARIERCVRALCRPFTLSAFAPRAAHLSGSLRPFLTLRDGDLGTIDYAPFCRSHADEEGQRVDNR